MLDVKRLNIFREVVSHGSFSAAADALDYLADLLTRLAQSPTMRTN